MKIEDLLHKIIESNRDLIDVLRRGESVSNLALRRSARLPLTSAIHAELLRPILLLTDRTDRALTLFDELSLLAGSSPRLLFPEPNPLFYENTPWGETTRRERLIVLTNLASYHIPIGGVKSPPPLIIAPIRAVMTRTMPRRDFLKSLKVIKSGQSVHFDELILSLHTLGYQHVNTVISPGEFARRGGIIDIWIPSNDYPLRLEFFGDELDTTRTFDPNTQRSLPGHTDIDRLVISPAREYLRKKELSIDEDESPVELSEFHIPILHRSSATILDYLPHQSLVILDNWENLQARCSEVEEQAVGLRADFIENNSLPPDFPLPYQTWAEIEDALSMCQTLQLGPASSPEESIIAKQFTPGPRFGGRLKPLLDHMANLARVGESIVIVSRQASRLNELWLEQLHPFESKNTNVSFLEGSLAEGWVYTPQHGPRQHLLTDGEIFGWRRPEPRHRHRAIASSPEEAYADLEPGDWVVHIDHGIGRFLGLVNRKVEGLEREYLAIEYAEGDQLFVPVHQADRLTPYISHDHRPPSISRLGGVEWRNAKVRAKEATEEVAEELLDLYAKRQLVRGHAFGPDTPWQQELEASFPYIETEDQARVIADVKQDMENPRPMDRLICGDVGYGKTEVALRAAFKSVMDGKQVAILVPTTVLAQQHFNTFRERLAAFPVEVEMLSRFRTPQHQKEILFRLNAGSIDIIIGTHRLLQADVKFKDLGLLIIDEEQRFGVTHKEYLKRMRTEVDVLTLTATPIPRTLYMALTGVRDISTINTPPEERLPIITHIGPYSKRLIRQAILRELERGGQVFFVHNRVQTISAMRIHLERLIPEARIIVAHGQLPEKDLSERMELFTRGEIDVLLTTSIIESGLDIPNANTLIVDRADTFGLAQLYQLRGRVGRGAQRAYAYFFKHRRRIPTYQGRQRLETIAENIQLGAGFSIAMRDLEIRGTGDILGTRQHGHIAAVGFHLYTRLLTQAVTRLRAQRGQPPDPSISKHNLQLASATVELPLDVGLTPDYVPDKNMRLRLYRRIADLRAIEEVDALTVEFQDRFGEPPAPVSNLLFQMKVKILAEQSGLAAVNVENGQIALRYRDELPPTNLPLIDPRIRVGKTTIWFSYNLQDDWQNDLVMLLDKIQKSVFVEV